MINGKSILAIIPARGGSKGVPRKNVKKLCGKPLIAWTIEEALKSKYIDKLVVSTEDEEIAQISKEYGSQVIKRPIELANDNSSVNDTVSSVLNFLKSNEGYEPSLILLLQCTSPFRKARHIDEAIYKLSVSNAYSVVSVVKEENPIWWTKVIKENHYIEDYIEFDRKKYKVRQDFPELYRLNGAIYIVKAEEFYKNSSLDVSNTIAYEMNKLDSIDIDNEIDFLFSEFLGREYYGF